MGQRILVTGGLGFIGSAFIKRVAAADARVLNIDLETYAGEHERLASVSGDWVETNRLDIASEALPEKIEAESPKCIVHFAAETHVTRSEDENERFFRSNLLGTRRVLEGASRAQTPLVIHISTDEVYGPCFGAPYGEDDKEPGEGKATSAYARSKALADDLAMEYSEKVPLIVARLSNCFGPWQHPEKAIPRWTTRALLGSRIPVWGSGRHIRDWMFVEDAVSAIEILIERGEPGSIYNVAPMGAEVTNLELASKIASLAGIDPENVYLTAYDRPSHDERYAIDASKILALGWHPSELDTRLGETIEWYRAKRSWWEPLLPEAETLYEDDLPRAAQRGIS